MDTLARYGARHEVTFTYEDAQRITQGSADQIGALIAYTIAAALKNLRDPADVVTAWRPTVFVGAGGKERAYRLPAWIVMHRTEGSLPREEAPIRVVVTGIAVSALREPATVAA